MTWNEFKKKWARNKGKEAAAYQEHFTDLCRLLGQPTPNEADPTGTESFCFQKRVVKDTELHLVKEAAAGYGEPGDRGFADVWKKDCFAWEYKGKKKNLDEAYRQLLRYRESLLNPPLLVVCDFDRYIVRTNFNGAVQETHEFTNATIDTPENQRLLRALFTDPEALRPLHTASKVTEDLAERIAAVARSLQDREASELSDARTRQEVKVAQKKNLRIARFLNRLIFCLFAEDVGLLPDNILTDLAKANVDDPAFFVGRLEALFRVMAKGGTFGQYKIRHFNGHLFEEATVFELAPDEIRQLAEAAEADWQFIQPSIMGTLFQSALEFVDGGRLRAQLGAHYTGEADIITIVEPVLMAPLRREWQELKRDLLPSIVGQASRLPPSVVGQASRLPSAMVGQARLSSIASAKEDRLPPSVKRRQPERLPCKNARPRIAQFLKKLSTITVLDPACGSANFLYIALRLLLDLEKEVIAFADQLGFTFTPQVGVHQLRAIEINPYAFELAQVTVQIGYLQWLRENGFPLDRSPVLQVLDGFQNEDALLVPHFRSKAKTLKQARAKEHEEENALKFYTEREWPACDVIVSNPPFLGSAFQRRELTDAYVDGLHANFSERLPKTADFCCYWFEKARELIKAGKCQRAGLLATQGIRGGANRTVLESIKKNGDIFFAMSDRDWILDGANVHVSMIGFDDGTENHRELDGNMATQINANLTATGDLTGAKPLCENAGLCLRASEKGGAFEIPGKIAQQFLQARNPNGKPNCDVVKPWTNADMLLKRPNDMWIVDFYGIENEAAATQYEKPFEYIKEHVRPERTNNRDSRLAKFWWLHRRSAEDMRTAIANFDRFIVTPGLSKHRVFTWIRHPTLPDHQLYVFARDDDYFFGILHSRFHAVWALELGTQLEDRPRYTPTTCFETFPFPWPPRTTVDTLSDEQRQQHGAIAAAAKELNDQRNNVLSDPNGDARTLTALYNKLEDGKATWLALAHQKLDAAVAAAYGWPADLADEQILERLLKLNLERAAAEAKTAQISKPKTSRAKREDELI